MRRSEARKKSRRCRKPIRWAVWVATPSQKATIKYFWVVSALILVQMLLGVVTAHYGVEGDGFYGFPLSQVAALQRDPDVARSDWACSGLPRPGWRPGCSSARWSASTNRRGNAWA